MKKFILVALALLTVALSGCQAQTQTPMRGQVVAKHIQVGSQSVGFNANDLTQTYALRGVRIRVPKLKPKTVTPKQKVTKIQPTVGTTGKQAAVKTLPKTNYQQSRWFKQSSRANTYFPFWYLAMYRRHDRQTRYLLTLKIGQSKRDASVSKQMYDQAKVGAYVQINGSHLKVLTQKSGRD